jgi:hypothetical protein
MRPGGRREAIPPCQVVAGEAPARTSLGGGRLQVDQPGVQQLRGTLVTAGAPAAGGRAAGEHGPGDGRKAEAADLQHIGDARVLGHRAQRHPSHVDMPDCSSAVHPRPAVLPSRSQRGGHRRRRVQHPRRARRGGRGGRAAYVAPCSLSNHGGLQHCAMHHRRRVVGRCRTSAPKSPGIAMLLLLPAAIVGQPLSGRGSRSQSNAGALVAGWGTSSR